MSNEVTEERALPSNEQEVMALFAPNGTMGPIINSYNSLIVSAVWCAVNIISGAFASLPIGVYNVKNGVRELDDADDLNDIIGLEPNPYMTSASFHETQMHHKLVWGNAYAEIERNEGGDPVALWPLLPDRTKPRIAKDGSLWYETTYGNSTEGSDTDVVKKKAVLPSYNVYHVPGLGFDGLVGYSVVSQNAKRSIQLAASSEESQNKFIENSSRPDGVLKTSQLLRDDTFERLKKEWEKRHRGLNNQFRTAILEAGLEYQQISVNPADAQLLETRKFQVVEVARWFNIPPHMLKDLDRATFSNIESQTDEFTKYTMLPHVTKHEQEYRRKLWTKKKRRKKYILFDFNILQRPAMVNRYKAYKDGVLGGWLKPNEVRSWESLEPVDDGNKLLIPSNTIPTADNSTSTEDASSTQQ